MTCDRITLPGGARAIVCSSRRRQRCGCGRRATRLCDWKIPKGRTCDAPLCPTCSYQPTPEKDLCFAHATAFAAWREKRHQAGAVR